MSAAVVGIAAHLTSIVPRLHNAVGRVVLERNGVPTGGNQFLEVANQIAFELDAVTLAIQHLSWSSLSKVPGVVGFREIDLPPVAECHGPAITVPCDRGTVEFGR